jgi:hypothetical protein
MATMSARYTVIDGEVVAQERGGVRHQLVPDALGSTVALYDDSGTKTDTFSYWPYGEGSGRTGTTTMKFLFFGNNRSENGNSYYFGYNVYIAKNINFLQYSKSGKYTNNSIYIGMFLRYVNTLSALSINAPMSPPVKNLCDVFDPKNGKKGTVCAQNCIRKLSPEASGDLIAQRIQCMSKWCKNPQIKKDDCERFDDINPCGQVARSGQGPDCMVSMCPRSYNPCSRCYGLGQNSCTVVHEVLHCCGTDDIRPGKPDFEPGDHHGLLDDISHCIYLCSEWGKNGDPNGNFGCASAADDPADEDRPRKLQPFR